MKCRVELLSPLHIGNGNELKMVDFYLDDDKKLIKRIDFNKFISYCFEIANIFYSPVAFASPCVIKTISNL